jgi:hypothetical protein
MARRQLSSCCFALLAFLLVIVPQSAWPQGASAAQTVSEIERLQALAAQIKQGTDQPQQAEPPPPQQPQTPPGERSQPGCIRLLGVTSDC